MRAKDEFDYSYGKQTGANVGNMFKKLDDVNRLKYGYRANGVFGTPIRDHCVKFPLALACPG